jgi:hypothetical protein
VIPYTPVLCFVSCGGGNIALDLTRCLMCQRMCQVRILLATLAVTFAALPAWASGATLPDGRGYELVSPGSMNGVVSSVAYASPDGEVLDWTGLGGCCGATTGAEQLYQSLRGPDGWATKGLTPAPKAQLEGFLEGQAPVYWSRDLDTTIYSTPETYDPGDTHKGSIDLYAQSADGALSWVSQGPLSAGATPSEPTFDGGSEDADIIAFSTEEPLTSDAVGLDEEASPKPQYLYVRDIAAGTTTLVNVKNDGTVVSTDGAVLGDGWYVGHGMSPNQFGSTTNAVSADGLKVFFESPPPEVTFPSPVPEPHLYMRDLAAGTTTPLDDPGSTGFARYEGASVDGSLVFFRSNEGLGGSATDLELYAFNTTTHQIGVVPPLSAVPVSDGAGGALDGHLIGICSISNDGSHVYLIAETVLTTEPNGRGQTAEANEPNFYVFDTETGTTKFIAVLGREDIVREFSNRGQLISQPDLGRGSVPTPDGKVMVFESKSDVTGENPEGPHTELAADAEEDATSIEVTDTSGIVAGRLLLLGNPLFEEKYKVKAVVNGTKLELERPLSFNKSAGEPVVQLAVAEIYRYVEADGSVTCLSCLGVGKRPIYASGLTGMGGSYAPANLDATMNASGSQVFFQSPEVLMSAATGAAAMHVYEWEGGQLYLLSEPHATESSFVFGSTPSGNDVFMLSGSQLDPEAEPNNIHTYDVRVGGGFPLPPKPDESCTGGGCPVTQPAPGPMPAPQTSGPGATERLRRPVAPASFSLRSSNRRQLAHFSNTGRLALKITAAAPGRAVVQAFAPLGPTMEPVGSTRVRFDRAHLTRKASLALSAEARERLAAGPLPLTIEVRNPKTGELVIERLELRPPTTARKARGRR